MADDKLAELREKIETYEATMTADVSSEEALNHIIALCYPYHREQVLDDANKAMTLIMNDAPRHITAEAGDLAYAIGTRFDEMKNEKTMPHLS